MITNCEEIGSIIVTVAVISHGSVIDFDLTNKQEEIFKNVRLFSKSGDYIGVRTSPIMENATLNSLNNKFQKNLTNSTFNELNEYKNYYYKLYKDYTDFYKFLDIEEFKNMENRCKIINNIHYDKAFEISNSDDNNQQNSHSNLFNFLNKVKKQLECFYSMNEGIFIVSIHENINDNEYMLIYPNFNNTNQEKHNLNISKTNELRELYKMFNNIDKFPNLKEMETPLITEQETDVFLNDIYNKNLTTEEIDIEKEKFRKYVYEKYLNKWKITLTSKGNIHEIRMSYLIELIKNAISIKNCKINLLDYTCSEITKYMPTEKKEKSLINLKKMNEINYKSQNWGGKKLKRNKSIRKNKSKRYKIKKNKTKKIKKRIKFKKL